MKKILLISNYVFHYRINNYNYFYDEFLKFGYEFNVLSNKAQKVNFEVKFPLYSESFGLNKYVKLIKHINPEVIITFLHLKDLIIFPLTYYCKIRKIPVVYWNFGINLDTPKAFFKNSLYYHLHNLSNALILYSPNEKRYIRKKNHDKTFIGYNTLNFTNISKEKYSDKNYLKNICNVKENHIVFFAGRITKAKKLDLLLQCFRHSSEIALIIAGYGFTEEQVKIINSVSNYYAINERFISEDDMRNYYNSIDIFCTPGNPGLALNEAFFWGKPVITMKGIKSPEIYYLKNGYNGYIADSVEDMERKAVGLLNDRARYLEMSENARKTYENEAHISRMFNGFKEAVAFVMNKKNSKLKKR